MILTHIISNGQGEIDEFLEMGIDIVTSPLRIERLLCFGGSRWIRLKEVIESPHPGKGNKVKGTSVEAVAGKILSEPCVAKFPVQTSFAIVFLAL